MPNSTTNKLHLRLFRLQRPRGQPTNIWYNSLFTMTVFGLLGGLVGAISGEVGYSAAIPDRLAEYQEIDSRLSSNNDGP